jgi:hypothetical protein
MPEGGTIGFGLRFAYPRRQDGGEWDERNWNKLTSILKGSDATLIEVLRSLGLEWEYKVIYDLNYDPNNYDKPPLLLPEPSTIRGLPLHYLGNHTQSGQEAWDGEDSNLYEEMEEDGVKARNDVVWIYDPKGRSPRFIKNAYLSYGNEVSFSIQPRE